MTGIEYFGPAPPKPGGAVELYPGIVWARIQLPFRPGWVNVWLLEDRGRWTIVDCGFDWEPAREGWKSLLHALGDPVVSQILVTHAHFDHVGLSGWLRDRFGATSGMAPIEFEYVQFIRSDWDLGRFKQFFRAAGCTETMVEEFAGWKEWAQRAVEAVPIDYIPLHAGDEILIGGRTWRLLCSGGHSRGQLAFWCERDAILIGGDIVLPRIHASIGVSPSDSKTDPVADALAGWRALRYLPADTAVLPSHGVPFTGLHARLDQHEAQCRQRLECLLETCSARSVSASDAMTLVYGNVVPSSPRIAVCEMQAYLNYLEIEGQISRSMFADGVARYRRARA